MEGPKLALLLRGNKTSEMVMNFMKDIVILTTPFLIMIVFFEEKKCEAV